MFRIEVYGIRIGPLAVCDRSIPPKPSTHLALRFSGAGGTQRETTGLGGTDRAEQSGGCQGLNCLGGESTVAIDGCSVWGYARAAHPLERRRGRLAEYACLLRGTVNNHKERSTHHRNRVERCTVRSGYAALGCFQATEFDRSGEPSASPRKLQPQLHQSLVLHRRRYFSESGSPEPHVRIIEMRVIGEIKRFHPQLNDEPLAHGKLTEG